ncbi:MAG: DUF58 domain-containing protein [Actinomycetaceae bacterium]|nr:DUF58 domain-containing protein [Actinomycetaceae bacterium]
MAKHGKRKTFAEAAQTAEATASKAKVQLDADTVAPTTRESWSFSRMRSRLSLIRVASTRAITSASKHGRDWLNEHITTPGYVAIFLAVLGLAVGIPFGLPEWIFPGFLALFLLLIALLFLFGGNSYTVAMGLRDEHVVAGEPLTASVTITNNSKRFTPPGILEIPIGEKIAQTEVPLLSGGAVNEQELAIPAHKRGVIEIGPIRSVRTDPLNLLHRDVQWTDKYTLYVHPKTALLPVTARGFMRDLEGTPSNQLVTDDISFHAIREYMPGDSPRNIHWKTTAKTGNLMVRQFEETRKSTVGVLLSLAEIEYLDEEEFEVAVSAAASLAVRFIRDHQEIEILVSKEVPKEARPHFSAARRLATHSPVSCLNDFTVIDHGADMMTLDDIARVCAHNVDMSLSNIFLVTGSRTPLRSLQMTAEQFASDVAVTIVRVDVEQRPSLRFISHIPMFTLGAVDDLRYLMSRVVQS